MIDKTFAFTIEQIKEIYRAGIRRGGDEATAYEWGSTPTGQEFDDCVDAIYDIINKGIDWEDPSHTSRRDIESWFHD
jgi:hypothetical protein